MTSWYARQENWTAQAEDARNEGDVDYARVIHSASFRRLQGKTQILNLGDSDFYRTRLTHSLEVAQIAGGIVRQLRQDFPDHAAIAHLPDHSLIQAIGVTHDLGQPRIELVGCPAAQLPWIKSIGCFTEIIQYRTRVFLPVPAAEAILGKLLETA